MTVALKEIRLNELGQFRAEALRCGEWIYDCPEGKFEITPERIAELTQNFKAGIKGFELPTNLEHEKGTDCGWVKDVIPSDDGQSLDFVFEITDPEVRKKVEEGTIKYVSAEMDFDWLDPETKKVVRVIKGLALTNTPYIKRMSPIIKLSETAQEHNMPDNTTIELAEARSTIERLERENRDAQARIQLAEREAREVKLSAAVAQTKAKLDEYARKGKLTVPLYRRAIRLSEALILGQARIDGPVTIHLSDGDGTETVDKFDIAREVIAMLGELPDNLGQKVDSMELEEEDGPEAIPNDDEAALEQEAERIGKAQPELSAHQRYKMAEIRLSERRGRKLQLGGKR